MTQGLRIWGEDGSLQLDENSFTMRVVHSSVVGPGAPSGQYFDISVPGITPANSAAVVVPVGPILNTDRQYDPQVLNDVVRVWRTVRGYQYPGATTSTMRLIVVRFK